MLSPSKDSVSDTITADQRVAEQPAGVLATGENQLLLAANGTKTLVIQSDPMSEGHNLPTVLFSNVNNLENLFLDQVSNPSCINIKGESTGHTKTKGQLKKQFRRKRLQSVKDAMSSNHSSGRTIEASDSDGILLSTQSSSCTVDVVQSKLSSPPDAELKSVARVKQEIIPVMPSIQRSYLIGELLWGRVSGHPWWPCMITYDPVTSSFIRLIGRSTRVVRQYHVQFFGAQHERGWVGPKHLMSYEGCAAFKALLSQHSDWVVSRTRQVDWSVAASEADRAMLMSRLERIQRLTFVYDSVLPAAIASRLPPTPVETPSTPVCRGVKRKAMKNLLEETGSVVAKCIDKLDAMAPPFKKQRKSVGRTVDTKTEDIFESLNVRKVADTKVPLNTRRSKDCKSPTRRTSFRKGLRNSIDNSNHVKAIDSLSNNANHCEKVTVLSDVNSVEEKSPPKHLSSANGTPRSSRVTRYITKLNSSEMTHTESAVELSGQEDIEFQMKASGSLNDHLLEIDVCNNLRSETKNFLKNESDHISVDGDVNLAVTEAQRDGKRRNPSRSTRLSLDSIKQDAHTEQNAQHKPAGGVLEVIKSSIASVKRHKSLPVSAGETETNAVEYDNRKKKTSLKAEIKDGMSSSVAGDQMLVLLGKISCNINMSPMTCRSKQANHKSREHQRTSYWLEGNQLCRETFKFLHGFHADTPDTVHMKYSADDQEQSFVMLRPDGPRLLSRKIPAPIPTPGLDGQRQTYLHRYIREFVEDPWKDVMCPVPGTVFPLETSRQQANVPQISTDEEADDQPVRGRGRGSRRGSSRGRPTGAESGPVFPVETSRQQTNVPQASTDEETDDQLVRGRGRGSRRGSSRGRPTGAELQEGQASNPPAQGRGAQRGGPRGQSNKDCEPADTIPRGRGRGSRGARGRGRSSK